MEMCCVEMGAPTANEAKVQMMMMMMMMMMNE